MNDETMQRLRTETADKLNDVYNATLQDDQGNTYMDMFWDAAIDVILQILAAEIERAEVADITEHCKCGHDYHSRYISTDCNSCSCQIFEPVEQSKTGGDK